MTVLNLSTDIPAGINSLEKLAVWMGSLMHRINPTKEVREVPYADPERSAQFYFLKDDDGVNRVVIRMSIAINADYAASATKFWNHALDLSNTDIPAAFKTN